jgi:tetratricopeptide (TPR) repeat protein
MSHVCGTRVGYKRKADNGLKPRSSGSSQHLMRCLGDSGGPTLCWAPEAGSSSRVKRRCGICRLTRRPRIWPTYTRLGFGHWQTGDLTEALDATDHAIRLVADRHMPASRRFADILDLRGSVLLTQGKFDKARAAFSEAYDIFRLIGHEHGMARSHGNLAEVEFACGNAATALALINEVAGIFSKLRFASRLATCRVNAAAYQLALGEIDAAESAAEALRLAQRTQDTPLIAIATRQVATVLALRGQARSAALLIGYVDKWYEVEGSQRERSEQKIYEMLVTSLSAQLVETEQKSLMKHGSRLTEKEAANAALSLVD